jgi:hypothetical protein
VAAEGKAVLSPLYKWILLFLGVLCILSFLSLMSFAVAFDTLTDAQQNFWTTCDWIVKLTVGGFLGLVGGKAL